ncbi:hypothetical protein LAUMK40_01166 [Mycobacterium kansasii]|nr:hypothetical protein LAUMK40_01166 [Mycobacterium kansasii]
MSPSRHPRPARQPAGSAARRRRPRPTSSPSGRRPATQPSPSRSRPTARWQPRTPTTRPRRGPRNRPGPAAVRRLCRDPASTAGWRPAGGPRRPAIGPCRPPSRSTPRWALRPHRPRIGRSRRRPRHPPRQAPTARPDPRPRPPKRRPFTVSFGWRPHGQQCPASLDCDTVGSIHLFRRQTQRNWISEGLGHTRNPATCRVVRMEDMFAIQQRRAPGRGFPRHRADPEAAATDLDPREAS